MWGGKRRGSGRRRINETHGRPSSVNPREQSLLRFFHRNPPLAASAEDHQGQGSTNNSGQQSTNGQNNNEDQQNIMHGANQQQQKASTTNSTRAGRERADSDSAAVNSVTGDREDAMNEPELVNPKLFHKRAQGTGRSLSGVGYVQMH